MQVIEIRKKELLCTADNSSLEPIFIFVLMQIFVFVLKQILIFVLKQIFIFVLKLIFIFVLKLIFICVLKQIFIFVLRQIEKHENNCQLSRAINQAMCTHDVGTVFKHNVELFKELCLYLFKDLYLNTMQNVQRIVFVFVQIFVFEHNVECWKNSFPRPELHFARKTCKFEFANCFHRNPLELKGAQHAKPTKSEFTFCFTSNITFLGCLSHKCFHFYRRPGLKSNIWRTDQNFYSIRSCVRSKIFCQSI